MNKIKIMLADDHLLFLEGIRELLDKQPDMEVVAMTTNGEDLLIKMNAYNTEVVLLDIQMPGMNGMEVAAEMRNRFPEVKIIVLSMHSERSFVVRMYEYGVMGYLLKNTGRDELLEAIRTVHQGKLYFGQHATHSVLRKQKSNSLTGMAALSKRETEILVLIAREYSNPDIAKQLHLSVETVNSHRKNLLQKLGAKNTAGLVKHAIYNHLV